MKYFLKNIVILMLWFSSINIALSLWILQTKVDTKIEVIGQEKIDSAHIIILGDSRADRQLNPKIIHSKTNLDVLNIAESGLDLYSLSLRLKNTNVKNKLIIISASSWQVNDGATDEGYFRVEAFNNLDAMQRLILYRDNPIELKKMLSKCLISPINITIGNKERAINRGFNNVKCKNFSTDNMFRNHPFYRNIRMNGIKTKLLKDGLIELNKLNCSGIIIYNAPVCTEFINQAKNNGAWLMENEYCKTISNFIQTEKLKKTTFIDLRNLRGFSKEDYYDPQHFCEQGANKFTSKFIPIINKVITSSKSNQNHQGSN
jgi:hypothetical protein